MYSCLHKYVYGHMDCYELWPLLLRCAVYSDYLVSRTQIGMCVYSYPGDLTDFRSGFFVPFIVFQINKQFNCLHILNLFWITYSYQYSSLYINPFSIFFKSPNILTCNIAQTHLILFLPKKHCSLVWLFHINQTKYNIWTSIAKGYTIYLNITFVCTTHKVRCVAKILNIKQKANK